MLSESEAHRPAQAKDQSARASRPVARPLVASLRVRFAALSTPYGMLQMPETGEQSSAATRLADDLPLFAAEYARTSNPGRHSFPRHGDWRLVPLLNLAAGGAAAAEAVGEGVKVEVDHRGDVEGEELREDQAANDAQAERLAQL